MTSAISAIATRPTAFDSANDAARTAMLGSRKPVAKTPAEKARAQAQDFEAMFLNSMFEHMFTGIGDQGPLGNSTGTGVWRSFLVDAFSKKIAKGGGIGIADQVYKTLLGQQEAHAAAATKGTQP